jgi:peptide deformylase
LAVVPVRIFGDPVLRARATEVSDFDDGLRRLAGDLEDTMRAANGAGLAATQIGVLRRVFTWQASAERHGVCVNPVVVETSEELQESDEGCLSFPGLYYPTKRALRVRLQMQDLDGDTVELQGEEVAARIYLHEVDHLNGILFIDHLARHDRKEAMRRIRAGELEHPPPPDRDEPPAG